MPSFSDDEEEDDDDIDWIEFKQDDDVATDVPDTANSLSSDLNDSKSDSLPNQCMYIQMEYCEKSTLR